MKKWMFIVVIAFTVAGFTKITGENNDSAAIKTAINKSLPLLQGSSHTFLINAVTCHSCHGQALGLIAFSLAKEKGYTVQDTIVKEAIESTISTWKNRMYYLAQNDDPAAIVISGGYDLWAFAATRTASEKTIELLAKNMMHRQRKDGSWVSPNERPPLEYYSFSATAMTVKGIQAYMPAIYNDEVQARITKARDWMMKKIPAANEEKIFQLLGLTWTHGDRAFIRQQAKKLIAAQRPDGGWAQLDSLPSDAYATGQSLYALNQSGQLPVADSAYQKGVQFLLRTQFEDGSWKVKTRSFPSVPFVDSGFPHSDHQFISAAGSNWATIALLLASD